MTLTFFMSESLPAETLRQTRDFCEMHLNLATQVSYCGCAGIFLAPMQGRRCEAGEKASKWGPHRLYAKYLGLHTEWQMLNESKIYQRKAHQKPGKQ